MTDAALEALPPKRRREFLAHAGLCTECRGEWEAAMAFAVALNSAVESLVAGEPSPQFAARLRVRIAEEPTLASRPFLGWPVSSAGALAAAAALLAVLLIRSPAWNRPATERIANNAAPIVKPAQTPAKLSPVLGLARRHSASRRVVPRRQSGVAGFSFEVLVTKGQLSAALLLSEATSDGSIDGAQFFALAQKAEEPIELKALEIAPLEVPGAGDSADSASSQRSGRF